MIFIAKFSLVSILFPLKTFPNTPLPILFSVFKIYFPKFIYILAYY